MGPLKKNDKLTILQNVKNTENACQGGSTLKKNETVNVKYINICKKHLQKD